MARYTRTCARSGAGWRARSRARDACAPQYLLTEPFNSSTQRIFESAPPRISKRRRRPPTPPWPRRPARWASSFERAPTRCAHPAHHPCGRHSSRARGSRPTLSLDAARAPAGFCCSSRRGIISRAGRGASTRCTRCGRGVPQPFIPSRRARPRASALVPASAALRWPLAPSMTSEPSACRAGAARRPTPTHRRTRRRTSTSACSSAPAARAPPRPRSTRPRSTRPRSSVRLFNLAAVVTSRGGVTLAGDPRAMAIRARRAFSVRADPPSPHRRVPRPTLRPARLAGCSSRGDRLAPRHRSTACSPRVRRAMSPPTRRRATRLIVLAVVVTVSAGTVHARPAALARRVHARACVQ